MKCKIRRMIGLVLAVILCFCMLPTTAFALVYYGGTISSDVEERDDTIYLNADTTIAEGVTFALTQSAYQYIKLNYHTLTNYGTITTAYSSNEFDGGTFYNYGVCEITGFYNVAVYDLTLSSIALSSGTLSPSFAAGTREYAVTVDNSVTSIGITPTLNTGTGVKSMTVNGTTATSGAASTVSLSVGENSIPIVITADDGSDTTNTYTLTVTRQSASCSHSSYTNGFCDDCGAYQPATLNSEGVYEISNAGQLFWFASLVSGDTTQKDITAANTGANAVLTTNITIPDGYEWTPIGTKDAPYTGTFDGDGYTVSGMSITTASTYMGLFGYVSAGTVKNLTVSGAIDVSGSSLYAGGIVGTVSNNGTLSNLTSNVSVTVYDSKKGTFGGVAATVEGGSTMELCVNNGTVKASGVLDCVGGLVGYMNSATITNCANYGTVDTSGGTAASSDGIYTGGIIAYINNANAIVTNCVNVGTVSGVDSSSIVSYTGAIVGRINQNVGEVSNCYYLSSDSSTLAGVGANGSGVTVEPTAKTTAEFASGEVAYLLNGSVSAGTTWYQNLDSGTADSYPVLDSSHGAVYYGTNCAGTAIYSNSTVPAATHSLTHVEPQGATCTETGNSEYWYCSVCGGYFSNMSGDTTTLNDVTIAAIGHSLTYTASENIITESCANWWCGHSATATLAEPGSLAYDGSSKAASVSCGTDWKGDTPTVEYLDSSGAVVDAENVVNAGTYTAQITVGGATASVSFTITATQLSVPVNLRWSGTTTTVTASWDEVTNAGSYTVQLYKDGAAEGNAVSVTETSTTFTITEAGSYTFTVTAVGTDNYSSSAESEASTALNFYTVTWKNDDNTLKTDMVQSGVTLSYSGDEPTKDTDGTYIYTFSGWSPTVGAITDDTTYTAVYSLTYVAPAEGAGYSIDYSDETAAAASGYEISTDGSTWSSTLTVTPDGTLYVRRAADTAASASAETTNTLASRPGAPSVTAVDEQWQGENDGQITGVTTAMEYSADGSTWTACTGTTIDSLAAGTYYVRYKATDSAFSGEAASVTIGSGTERTYSLAVAAPAFDDVTYGYTQPDAKAITITNSGNSDATITSVTVSSASFTIAGSGSTVTAQGTNTSYTIRPVAGLNTGTYTATIIVAYDGGATAEAEVSITVNKAAQSLSYSGDSVIKHINDEAFTNELTRTTVDGAISYASDNTDAATVDENGKVTITGAGTAIITATAAETDNYNKTTASYTLTVTDHSYTATVIAPTYTEQGYTLHICEDCGDSYKTDYTAIRVIDGTDEDLTTKTTVQETADTATQTDNTTDNTDTSGTSASGTTSVQTGDNSRLVLWLVLLLISGAGVVGIAVYHAKRKHSR